MDKEITVIIKRPREAPVVDTRFPNTLEAFQRAVGGYIECVHVATDAVIVCNEEGRLRNLTEQWAFGTSWAGPIVVAGCAGEDFSPLTPQQVRWIYDQLRMEGRWWTIK